MQEAVTRRNSRRASWEQCHREAPFLTTPCLWGSYTSSSIRILLLGIKTSKNSTSDPSHTSKGPGRRLTGAFQRAHKWQDFHVHLLCVSATHTASGGFRRRPGPCTRGGPVRVPPSRQAQSLAELPWAAQVPRPLGTKRQQRPRWAGVRAEGTVSPGRLGSRWPGRMGGLWVNGRQ